MGLRGRVPPAECSVCAAAPVPALAAAAAAAVRSLHPLAHAVHSRLILPARFGSGSRNDGPYAARFGNVLEFGHNYLPEFTESTYGQFSLHYLAENVGRLLRLPAWEQGKPQFPLFDGVAFWLVSPIFLCFAADWLRSLWNREKGGQLLAALTAGLVAVHFLLLALHKTMGGWHFGNRYTVDAIPFLFLALIVLRQGREPGLPVQSWSLFTLALNIAGTVSAYLM